MKLHQIRFQVLGVRCQVAGAVLALGAALLTVPGVAQAQREPAATPAAAAQSSQTQQQREQSLAEAARRAQAQKAQAKAAKPERTFDTDSLLAPLPMSPQGQAAVSDLAPGAAPAAGTTTVSGTIVPDAPSPMSAATTEEEEERTKAAKAVEEAKAQVAALKAQLELMERDNSLARQQFYQNPAPQTDKGGKAALDAQEAAIAAKKIEITEAEAKVVTAEAELETINARLGPKPERELTPAEVRDQWAARLAPLQAELAQVEAEIARVRAETTAAGAKPADIPAGSFTSNQLANLETKRAALTQQIADIQDEARRARVPAGWVRP